MGVKWKYLLIVLIFSTLLICYNLHVSQDEPEPKLIGPNHCRSTLVSAYYNISSKHSPAEYMSWMNNFLSLQDCMLIFTSEDLVNTIRNLRPADLPLKIISRELKDFRVAQMLDKKGWERQESLDPELDVGHSRELYWIWNEKSYMLEEATKLNPFYSTYFVWLDIGAIRHSWWNEKMMIQKLPEDSGILLLQVGKFSTSDLQLVNGISRADFFQESRIGGGMIGGDAEQIQRWCQIYYKTLKRYFSENRFGGKDQSVMATTCLESDICLLVDGCPAHPWLYNEPNWFRLQDYFLGRLSQYPTRLNVSKV